MEYQKNEDGEFILDENGEKIPVKTTKKDEESDKDKVIADLVEQIKDFRLQNATMKDVIEKGKETPPETPKELTEDDKIALKVKEALQAEKSSNAQANKKAAFEKFVADNKEFHPDNDQTGLKRDALQKKFNLFNTDGLVTIEEFYSVIGDAKKLLLGNDTPKEPSEEVKSPHSSTPTPKSHPNGKPDDVLTPEELKLAETTGRTKEQIIKLKAKHPDLVDDLSRYIRS